MGSIQNYNIDQETENNLFAFLDQYRSQNGLRKKGKYRSNFIFGKDEKNLEITHILRVEFDEIYLELLEQKKQSKDLVTI